MGAIGNRDIFSKNLRYYIEKSGKDRRELADIWGFPYSTVTEWINGKKYPRIDRIEVMAEYFGVLKSDLIEEKMTEEKEKDNEAIADIIVRLRTDKKFYLSVEALHKLDSEQLDSLTQMLQALTK